MPDRTDYDYLIVGGGMVADSAARGIRERDADGSIGIIALEEDPPATRPALTKKLWTDPEFTFDKVWLNTEADTGAVRHAGLRASRIDTTAQTVGTDSGDVFGYGTLLIATGGTPHTLELPHDERVVYFRSVEDYRRLRGLAGEGREVAVIGGSFIGTELAAALVQNNTAVTLVFPEDVLGGAVFPAELAARFQKLYENAGVALVPGTTLERGSAGPVRLELELSNGDRLETDAVVTGLGIEPNVGIARDAHLEVDDGVIVDDRLCTSDPHIFAAGDIASYPDVILGRRRIEHVDNATSMGTCVGRNMAGADEPYDHTPYFYSAVFGNRYEAVGTLDSSLTTVEEWNEPQTSGVVYYLNDGNVVGVLLWNVPEQRDAARAVIDADGPWTPEKLRGRIPVPAGDR
ncbi:NAD(P)/FAD-dependent oxidoreductase [Humibacter albus]|uniref:NAD(P)/FAD-dependent oxidoreductase n=1 Tax=Humibacter albus TaxID=427754 RepID=UPI0003B4473E|nr:FAD-dependent oxidoreductase [Humibacter albus]